MPSWSTRRLMMCWEAQRPGRMCRRPTVRRPLCPSAGSAGLQPVTCVYSPRADVCCVCPAACLQSPAKPAQRVRRTLWRCKPARLTSRPPSFTDAWSASSSGRRAEQIQQHVCSSSLNTRLAVGMLPHADKSLHTATRPHPSIHRAMMTITAPHPPLPRCCAPIMTYL